jgi:DHA1 family bicyclomycin/chloramphenicol resistance-like MFS transporter
VLLGLIAYTLSSLGCALCNDVWTLSILRLIQGAAGAAGIVVARAIVRDLYEGVEAARLFSRLIVVFGLAPILAPIIGGQLLHITDWRGIFIVLAAIGAVLLAFGWRYLAETLPPQARHRGGITSTMRVLGVLIRNRGFAGLTLIYGLMFGAVFAYIAGSPFIVENIFGFSPQLFGVVFAVNAAALVSVSQLGIRFLTSTGPRRLAEIGLSVMAVVGALLLVGVLTHAGAALVLPCFFVLLGSYGLVSPNLTALAMAPFPRSAGSSSALMGLVQFWTGAAVAPLVGLGGTHDALPTALVISISVIASVTIWWVSVSSVAPRSLADEAA